VKRAEAGWIAEEERREFSGLRYTSALRGLRLCEEDGAYGPETV